MTRILAFDTSCDDTSAAVVDTHVILSNVVSSQIALHQPYGGVFPTVAKLAHQQNIAPVCQLALRRAHLTPADLDGVAVTVGPGLAPALEIGITFARDFAAQHHLPLIGVNHLEGHLLSPLLTRNSAQKTPLQPPFPAATTLGLIVSGGHSEFIHLKNFGDYTLLGTTLDDAAGECLDKIGRMLGLGYPAAPVLEQLALEGDASRHPFPLPLTTRRDYHLSFSGLKTFARNLITKLQTDQGGPLTRTQICDLAAAAQAGVVRHLLYKLTKILDSPDFAGSNTVRHLFLGGGVAANLYLRSQLRALARARRFHLHTPVTKRLCGDNAAMIALPAALQLSDRAPHSNLALDRQPALDL